MDKKDNARGQIAEKIVKTDYEVSNIKISYLIISKEHNKLDIAGLSGFLKNHGKKEEILTILKMLNEQKKKLPDFIIIDCSNQVIFVEVKSWNSKVTLAQIDEKEAIKTLADRGYTCIIKNVKIPASITMGDDEIEKQLIEYGQIMKGNSQGKPIYYLQFLKEELQSKPYPNVSIWDLIVNLNKGNV